MAGVFKSRLASDHGLDPFVPSVGCVKCSSFRSQEKTAELLVLSLDWNFYHCSRCGKWLKVDPRVQNAAYVVTSKRTIKALNWYYVTKFELAEGHRQLDESIGRRFRGLKDFFLIREKRTDVELAEK